MTWLKQALTVIYTREGILAIAVLLALLILAAYLFGAADVWQVLQRLGASANPRGYGG